MRVFETPKILICTFTTEDILTASKPEEPTKPSIVLPEDTDPDFFG
ncbi:MAG: hypothetical protein ACI3VX_01010 [Faecousia sp.]